MRMRTTLVNVEATAGSLEVMDATTPVADPLETGRSPPTKWFCDGLTAATSAITVPLNHSQFSRSNISAAVTQSRRNISYTYTVFQKKTPTHIVGYKVRNSCLILMIFDTKIPDII